MERWRCARGGRLVVKKYTLRAREISAPILEPVTKLGGQPVWLDTPQWPLSRALGTPMRFIGQFALASDIFGAYEAQLAYLFMTDDPDAFVDGTWLPDGARTPPSSSLALPGMGRLSP